MGADGAAALGKVKQAGGFTLAQDVETGIVFGMPKEAIKLGHVMEVQPLGMIAQSIVDFASGKRGKKRAT